ncbi:SusC/RagA family TonB-linked outer membrane protein [Christiangramia crocea]|uniref:TonB-dependent receptor n=1 Tax=Christiangramia crocea TaxID=2904124 RepID=A0A9X1V0W5_9FLAO|nr:TonB-dependent receptor [Gramella crocea]MCG9972838.1 TonB-dependent receptor [Gramella crocea]
MRKYQLKRNRFRFLFYLTLIFSVPVVAQNITVTGTVSAKDNGEPLPGVNIIQEGTSNGVVTDMDGEYSIEAPSNSTLVFSYLGFVTQEVEVDGRETINITLTSDMNQLDDIVVVGYGTQKKSDLTGSVSVVDADEAKKVISPDVAKLLQGQAAGVTVQSSGEPGGFVNIKIRGVTSFNNNNPLFVVDGVIVDSPFDFPTGDIESIQVLKDASAAAIYGQRGANGVVIITTEKGKEGTNHITYRSQVGIQTVPNTIPLTNRVQYQDITSAAEINAGLEVVPGNDPDSEFYIDDVDTDWQEVAYKTGMVENHTLGFSGGSGTINYNLNLDYFKNKGYIETPQDYERYSATLDLNGEKGRFRYGGKIAVTSSDKNNFSEYLAGQTAVIDLLQAIPTMPVYDENRLGGYGGADNLTQRAITLNVIGFQNLITNLSERNRFLGNIYGEFDILDGLTYRFRASADRLDTYNKFFNPPSDLGWYYITTNSEAALDVSNGSTLRTIVDNLLSYDKTFDEHTISALAGVIQERSDYEVTTGRGVGFKPDEISKIQFADAISGTEYENTVTALSYLSRLNYGYDDRYLLTLNFRRDKSSLFAEENNTGDYFSVSGAWKLHNESFFELPGWWNSLKLRGGYGQLGNNTIGPYDYAAVVNPFASYAFGNSLAPGTIAIDIKDPDVKWEDTETWNAALEAGLFSNKLQFTAEWFKKRSSDLLADVPLPFSTGAFPASITTNAAIVENTGLEFAVSYSNAESEFQYNISANLGTLDNEVLKIGADDIPISGAASRTEVGRSIGELYAFETEGLFQDQAEIDAHADQPGAAPGDVKFRDVNGDGIITDDDRTFQGVTIPKISYGLNFSSTYKNFDFSFFFQGNAGNKVFNATYQNLMVGQYTNHHIDLVDYWRPDNTDTNVPRPVIGDPNGNNRPSDRFIEDGSYIKLQNLQLGYSVPLVEDLFINSARVYVTGQNLWTISDYRGYDPDFISDGLFSRGFARGSFPNPTTVALGVEVQF